MWYFFSWLQLLGAICSENMGGVAAVINDGKGGVTTVTNPLEPTGLSENDTLEWWDYYCIGSISCGLHEIGVGTISYM